jgi:outer membrane protein TolC
VLAAFHDVDNALTAYRSAAKQHQQLIAAAKQNREAFRLAGERYKKGLGDYLEVLTAQRTWLETGQQVSDSAQAETVAMVQLGKALGGGWETQFPVKDAHD